MLENTEGTNTWVQSMFWGGICIAHLFGILCCVFCFVYLPPVWIVYFWLPLWYSLIFIYMYYLHVCFQTIFQMLPWLFLIPDDEWISPQQFEPIVSSISTCIPVYNSNEKLKTETPGSWRFKNPGNGRGCNVVMW